MGTSILFVPLGKDRHAKTLVPLATFRRALAAVDVAVPEFPEGSTSWDFQSSPDSSFVIHEMGRIDIENGAVSSFGIERPCSPNGPALWLALLRCGFVMIPNDGPAFASPHVIAEAPYLQDPAFLPSGAFVASTPEDFGARGFAQIP